jgi:tripartite-type tricarboxylate transporter receptor subunit TctC
MSLFKSMATIVATCLCLLGTASASDWPNKPVKMIVPFPPGGGTDVTARVLAKSLEKIWKQPVIVENRAGGSGIPALNHVLSQPVDGHTILYMHSVYTGSMAFAEAGRGTPLPYSYKDFVPVTQLYSMDMAVFARADAPFNTIQEVREYARKNPTKMNVGTPGVGTTSHLFWVKLENEAGFKTTHIPFKGTSQVITELVGGRLDLAVDTFASYAAQIAGGKVKVIASLGQDRTFRGRTHSLANEIAPGFNATTFQGFVVAPGTPRVIIDRMRAGGIEAMKDPEVLKFFDESSLHVVGNTPEQFDRFMQKQIRDWAKVIRDNNIQKD